jgi:site-specific DNA-methyltransferase (adenine-specific)
VAQRRRPTSTSAFGVSRRESHDSSAFYARFTSPETTADETVNAGAVRGELFVADARHMDELAPDSVALVVTSPPYFAGKEYEEALGQGQVPGSYLEYLSLLEDVFAECVAKLEPGGRIAVNVANLGRRPYRSLSADVVGILQDRLRLLLRGEVVWVKGRGATGSCAWGSFASPANPVLRDLTERVVIASKGRFDRAVPTARRRAEGLPGEASITADEFLEATTDVWEIPAESAKRVGHPAPFPVELPQRLIELYTYRDDLVLDPFAGSGTTAVAALRTGRRFAGYDTDPGYVARARQRVQEEREHLLRSPALFEDTETPTAGARAIRATAALLESCGFAGVREGRPVAGGVQVDLEARDGVGRLWRFDVCGTYTTVRGGLRRAGTLWRALGRAAVVSAAGPEVPFVLLTTDLPLPGTPGDRALRTVRGGIVFDVIELGSPTDRERLRRYATAS